MQLSSSRMEGKTALTLERVENPKILDFRAERTFGTNCKDFVPLNPCEFTIEFVTTFMEKALGRVADLVVNNLPLHAFMCGTVNIAPCPIVSSNGLMEFAEPGVDVKV